VDEKLDAKTIAGLLGLLAHDLRNPLSALHSNVGFLAATPKLDEADMRDAVGDALVSCDGLVAIIDNIELLAQSMAGVATRGLGPVAVAPTVAQSVAAHRAMAETHEVALEVDASANDPKLFVAIHRDMYRRALANVLRNAIQHGAGRPVRVEARSVGSEVQVVIVDQGSRLDVALGDEPFTAAGQLTGKSKTGARYGRGLGLFCARFAAESAGARLEAIEPPPGAHNAFALIAPGANA
jgi:two-component system sensor histidine kinase MtrB